MKLKAIIGILLIIASLGGIYLWETQLRDRILYTDVLVASTDISPGDVITEDSLSILSINTESLVEGYLSPSDKSIIEGKISITSFKLNSQLYKDAFVDSSSLDPQDSYTVNIPMEWIYVKNANIIPGDIVDIYQLPEKEFLGTFAVKNIDAEEDKYIEIQCRMEEYFCMYDYIKENKENKLLLVASGSIWNQK